jgi:hypothetical protein
MGLHWDPDDARQLVAQLAPPTAPAAQEHAASVLKRIYRALARELYQEQDESQKNEQVRQELEALRRALEGLSGRATNILCNALDDRLFLPPPLDKAQAVINPCRGDIPVTKLEPAVRLHALKRALDNVLENMPKDLRPGRPGVVSDVTYKALHTLSTLYCGTHDVPFPNWNSQEKITRNQEPLDFAISCLRAWGALEDGLWADELIRGLIHYRRKKQG